MKAFTNFFDALARRRGYVPATETKTIRVPMLTSRKFEAAGMSQMVEELPRTPQGIDHDLRTQWRILVARARWLGQNDDYVRRLLQILRQNIVGPDGIRLQSRIMKAAAGGAELDKVANQAHEDAWSAFGKQGIFEASGKLSNRDVQRLFVTEVTRDGEFLAIHNTGTKRNAFGYDLTVLDPLRLDSTLNAKTKDGNRIVMGVEVEPIGTDRLGQTIRRPVAYWLTRDRLDHPYMTSTHAVIEGSRYFRIPIDDVIHAFFTEFAEQTRGFTALVSGITRINMLGGYEDAVSVAARVGASSSIFVEESESGEGFAGDYSTEDPEAKPSEPEWEIEPGSGRMIPHGSKVHTFNPSQPQTQYADFVKATLRGAAAGWGVSYHTLANDLEGVNYSSSRTGELTDRDGYRVAQEFLIENLLEPIHARWLPAALMSGAIKIKGQPVGADKVARFSATSWQGRRWDWVDPLKSEQANDLKFKGRRASISQIIREGGRDPDEVFQEIADDQKKLEELGIKIEMTTPQPGTVAPADNQD